ncbi:ATP-binding cassette sub-family G member 4-like isoform X1 [Rhopalosiphum maidis]|uniref:ATP-binding cassette sub-family G member 4-like isoform X1 n=1 Tax=Rhopalosiphum maidis TaxID=43146 RepID=UPI000EFE8FEF|nr:ATP-binding cassette sub-family G member 4-like isoform X1 [Rhopalosiphum maidis]XP_026811602.1 ATP-binding cassette sub-family G member 4-like isoform X1 [Rhopalosiphum maidis]XP_026811603.1 ATP-binding cassette sub-family G member 4-like isoform X1 [Rhopalosiphum maidis]XP_026811604.1 ATP-binding cassette sub-family G member 4-like isoform X1 [Rhopalosiphum maidis]
MEMNSMLLNKGLDIRFADLTYEVNSWTDKFKIEKKTILKGVSGAFYQSQLCAIIGCSGSGKSSLLNALSGYKTNGYSGTIFINDKPQELKSFQKQSCYIMQEDQLHVQLTVRESMEFASKLKCLTLSLNASKLKMIDLILENLNLLKSQDTITINLSGGERRKLSIALELVHNPSIMFFDEPTSGLDSLSANQVLDTLRELANSGRNIISTIHQASASQLKIFDILYVLTPSGQCIYHGSTSNLLDYLAAHGLRCPLYHNTADYIIEISLGEYGDHAEKLVQYINNGKSTEWLKNTSQKHLAKEDKLTAVINDECQDGQFIKYIYNHLIQLIILSHRCTVKTLREKFIITRLLVHIIVSAVYGWVYFGVGINASFIHDNLMLLFFSLLFIMYTASSSMIINFPLEIQILSKEHFNQWYSLLSYYLSFTIVDLPIQVLCTFLYCVVLYYFTGQPLEWPRFGLYTLMMLMVGLLSQTIGMLMGTLFSDLRFSTILTSFLLMPWMMFGGIFIKISDTPEIFRWLFDISFMKHAMEGIVHCVYGMDRPRLYCPKIYCYSTSPSNILKDLDMPVNKYWFNFLAVTTIYLLLKVLTYLVLKKKLEIH